MPLACLAPTPTIWFPCVTSTGSLSTQRQKVKLRAPQVQKQALELQPCPQGHMDCPLLAWLWDNELTLLWSC